jgi:hypothetical protein
MVPVLPVTRMAMSKTPQNVAERPCVSKRKIDVSKMIGRWQYQDTSSRFRNVIMDLQALSDFNLVAAHGGSAEPVAFPAGPRRRCRAGSPNWNRAWA